MDDIAAAKMVALCIKMMNAIEALPDRVIVLEWIFDEWNAYAIPKFGTVEDRADYDAWMILHGWEQDSEWRRQVMQYADRSALFFAHGNPASADNNGDETLMLKGKQAAMKMATTLLDGLTSMIRVFGNPPAPGPSGEIKEWLH